MFRGSGLKILRILLVALGLFVGLSVTAALIVVATTRKDIVITFDDREVDRDRFYVLLFPREELFADGQPLPFRAVISSLAENEQESLGVMFRGEQVMFPRGQFTVIPPETGLDQMVERLSEEVATWGEQTMWKKVACEVGRTDHATTVTFTATNDTGSLEDYIYRVAEDETVSPQAIRYRERYRDLAN